MAEIEEVIGQVGNLYRAVTGKEIPTTEQPYAPIPPEKDPSQHVQEQMDRLFQILSGRPLSAVPAAWTPPLTIWESQNDVMICLDIPGVPRDRIELNVQGSTIIVTGQRPSPANGEARLLRSSERMFGPFRRVIPLFPGWKASEMTARLREGVLEITIPREPWSLTNSHNVPIS